MNNPFGWILGFAWMLVIKAKIKLRPEATQSTWMPRWIQPYWMRCMGWEVNEGVLAFYKREKR
jgi:hypothetical protein